MASSSELKSNSLFDVTGKVALVTGGGTGIGLMAAQALAYNGAKVYIVGRRQEKLDAAVQHHAPKEGGPGQIIPIKGDITTKAGLDELVKQFSAKEQKLNILVNNAGINHGPTSIGEPAGAAEMKHNLWQEDGERNPERSSFAAWTDTYQTNVAAVYFTTVAFLPLLEAGTQADHGFSGTVIIISSMSGITKQSQGGMFSYNSSKGAVIHLNEMLATELANHEIAIRVNSIAPGFFPSEMSTGESDHTGKSQAEKSKDGGAPAKRPGNDKDMASAVLFCATNQFLNGVTIPVDGGWLLKN